MKKMIGVFLLLGGVPAFANFGTSGCGLGAWIVGEKPGIFQIFGATLNATGANQSFAISSGTSECESDLSGQKQAENFIKINRMPLQKEAARGQGETLNGLATVLNCQNSEIFSQKMKSNYARLFEKEDLSDQKIAQELTILVSKDSELSTNCRGNVDHSTQKGVVL